MNQQTPVPAVYEAPTIVFEGTITTRAGSIVTNRDAGIDVFGGTGE